MTHSNSLGDGFSKKETILNHLTSASSSCKELQRSKEELEEVKSQ
jgi:hypothetical protein